MPNQTALLRDSGPNLPKKTVAVLAYEGINAFELGLAVEVFGIATDWYRVVICSERPGHPLTANYGLKVIVDRGIRTLSRADTIIVPGSLDIVESPSPVLL